MTQYSFYHISKAHFQLLKVLLITLTILYITYMYFVMFNSVFWYHLETQYHTDWIVSTIHFLIVGVFIRFNWKMQYDKKQKWDNTWKFLFLGIIGMWLWMPNKREIVDL